MYTAAVIRNKGLESSYRYLGVLETDRLGEEQRLDVSHLALAPLERLALVITSDPGGEGKSCVRTCTYCFICCLYVFTYCDITIACIACGILPAF